MSNATIKKSDWLLRIGLESLMSAIAIRRPPAIYGHSAMAVIWKSIIPQVFQSVFNQNRHEFV
jgi:hypothetical protein